MEQTEEQRKAEKERSFIQNYILWLKYMLRFLFDLPP